MTEESYLYMLAALVALVGMAVLFALSVTAPELFEVASSTWATRRWLP